MALLDVNKTVASVSFYADSGFALIIRHNLKSAIVGDMPAGYGIYL